MAIDQEIADELSIEAYQHIKAKQGREKFSSIKYKVERREGEPLSIANIYVNFERVVEEIRERCGIGDM